MDKEDAGNFLRGSAVWLGVIGIVVLASLAVWVAVQYLEDRHNDTRWVCAEGTTKVWLGDDGENMHCLESGTFTRPELIIYED